MLLFTLIISACGPTATNTTKPNTASNTSNANTTLALACDDAQVIKDMKATIDTKYPNLKAIMTDLSAYSKDCSVNLYGNTDTLDNFKAFYDVASDTPNVVKVNIDNLFLQKSSGRCLPDEEPCGDICVPVGQCWTKNFTADANTNSNTNSNKNSNMNTNANSNSNSNARSKP